MTCARLRDALLDAAAGGVETPVLQAHLSSCSACRDDLAQRRARLSAFDATLAAELAAEPSAHLAARARRSLAAQPAAPRSYWLPALAAAVVVAGIAVRLLPARAPGTPPAPSPAAQHQGAPPAVTPPARAAATEAVDPTPPATRTPRPRARPGVPDRRQQELLARFAAAVASPEIEPRSLFEERPAVRPLVVPPIVIEPMAIDQEAGR